MLQWLVDYRQRCTELPVRSTVQPDYLRQLVPATAPEKVILPLPLLLLTKPASNERRARVHDGDNATPPVEADCEAIRSKETVLTGKN